MSINAQVLKKMDISIVRRPQTKNHTNSEYHPWIHVSRSPTSAEAIQQKLSHVVLYMFNVEQVWLSCHPENILNILQSMLGGLEQYITFLLQEWQKNRLNNILDIHDAVHYSLSNTKCELEF